MSYIISSLFKPQNYGDMLGGLRRLRQDGWYVERQGKGSHVILKHPSKKGSIAFPNHGSMEMATGTLNKILKLAGKRYARIQLGA